MFRHHHKGFTLVELVVVITLIAILGTIVIAVLNPARLITRTKDTVLKYHLATFGYTVNSLRSADDIYPTKAELLESLKNANDIGVNGFSFPVKAGTLTNFSYVTSTAGLEACLSTVSDDGHDLLWCSTTSDIKDDAGWCYDNGGNAGDCP